MQAPIVIVNYSSSKASADKVVAKIVAAGGNAEAIQGDFSKPEDISKVFTEKKSHEKIDVLVNSAGVYAFGPIDSVTPEEVYRQFNLNGVGLLLSTKEALPLFGPQGGSIINIGSGVDKQSRPTRPSTSARKAQSLQPRSHCSLLLPFRRLDKQFTQSRVLTGPELTAVTRIFRRFRSIVEVRAKERMATFVAAYTVLAGTSLLPTTEDIKTT